MSFMPRYANLIIQGLKSVEFRKTRFKREVSHIVMYSGAPEMKIIGIIETEGYEEDTPSSLWKRFHKEGGISKEDFMNYYGAASKGTAIKIAKCIPLKKHLKLSAIKQDLRPPQSFIYVDEGVLSKLIPRN
ncbi:TPA: hypothetical protein DDW35_03010 [Candidatus Sumerlaeota bacterium]|nr:hypothetical protein [Candidatus Sumerlaeota bacterium]